MCQKNVPTKRSLRKTSWASLPATDLAVMAHCSYEASSNLAGIWCPVLLQLLQLLESVSPVPLKQRLDDKLGVQHKGQCQYARQRRQIDKENAVS